MPRAYSLDLRERVLAAARDERLSQPAPAARFRVSEATVYHWLRRARETGTVAAEPRGGGLARRASTPRGRRCCAPSPPRGTTTPWPSCRRSTTGARACA